MSRRVAVQVTEKDISRAIRSDSAKCVVAQAIARTLPDAHFIDVDTQTIRYTDGQGKRLAYLTPYSVQGYVIAFDAGDHIEPFTFQLRDPIELRRKRYTPEGLRINRLRRTAAKPVEPSNCPDCARSFANNGALTNHRRLMHGVPNVPEQQTITEGRTPPARVFKTKKRSYGHRQMRINKELAAEVVVG